MKSRRAKLIFLSLILSLTAAIAIFIFALNRQHRTHLSQNLKFLKGYRPTRSELIPQGYTYRENGTGPAHEVFALIEEFELPMSYWDAHVLSRNELKPIAYTVTFDQAGHPPSSLYGVIDKETKDNLVVIVSGSSDKSVIIFKQTLKPSWLDRLFDRFRSWTTGKRVLR